jgi:hypothetical protein
MKKSRRYLVTFLPVSLLVIGIHFLIFHNWDFGVSPRMYTIIDIIFLILFWGGAFFVAPTINQGRETFVGKFLILTTFQILGFLSVAGALVFVKQPLLNTISYNMLIVFSSLLVIQSVLLISGVNRPDDAKAPNKEKNSALKI